MSQRAAWSVSEVELFIFIPVLSVPGEIRGLLLYILSLSLSLSFSHSFSHSGSNVERRRDGHSAVSTKALANFPLRAFYRVAIFSICDVSVYYRSVSRIDNFSALFLRLCRFYPYTLIDYYSCLCDIKCTCKCYTCIAYNYYI